MSELFTIDANPRNVTESIKIIGVGGGGNNALNHIIRSGLEGVQFIAANTDLRNLEQSAAETRITLGQDLTKGLGAGGIPRWGPRRPRNPQILSSSASGGGHGLSYCGNGGRNRYRSISRHRKHRQGFGILVVAVVTRPFSFEGKKG